MVQGIILTGHTCLMFGLTNLDVNGRGCGETYSVLLWILSIRYPS
jgi:hypothetical protein